MLKDHTIAIRVNKKRAEKLKDFGVINGYHTVSKLTQFLWDYAENNPRILNPVVNVNREDMLKKFEKSVSVLPDMARALIELQKQRKDDSEQISTLKSCIFAMMKERGFEEEDVNKITEKYNRGKVIFE